MNAKNDTGHQSAPRGDEKVTFVRGNERLRELRGRHPDLQEAVDGRREELRQADREHAVGLAMIRQAANLTQVELAAVLGVGQAAVAKMEGRPDLLLSTLRSYLEAAGGRARLVVEFEGTGHRVDVPLDSLVVPRGQRRRASRDIAPS